MLERGNFEANKKFLEKININWKGLKVLEVGCGNGSMTEYLSSLGCIVTAIDINEKYLKIAKERFPKLKFQFMSGEDLQFKEQSFDVVVSFDLLEHIPNVNKHIFEVYRVLKDDGLYLFQTPNKYSSSLFSIFRDKSLTKWKSYHPSLQTKNSLKRLFKDLFTLNFCDVDYFTSWYRNKLPFFLRNINPRNVGIETNIYVEARKL